MSKATSSKGARGSPFLRRAGRPSVRDPGSSPGPLPRPAVLFGTPATGGQCDHVASRPCPAAGGRSPRRPSGRRQGRQETRSRDRGPGCGLGSQVPQTLSEAEGARLERTPGPGIAGGGWVGLRASPPPRPGLLPGRLGVWLARGLESSAAPRVRDAQGRRRRPAAEGRAPARGWRRDLDCLPRGKGQPAA